MEPMTTFGVGLVLLSVPLSYALWIKVRVLRLRQDLRYQRDKLFDAAAANRMLDDPAYQSATAHIEALMGVARNLCFPMLIPLIVETNLAPDSRHFQARTAEMQSAVDAALDAATRRVAQYLMDETVTGMLLTWISGARRFSFGVEEAFSRCVLAILKSGLPISLLAMETRRIQLKSKLSPLAAFYSWLGLKARAAR